MHASGIHQAGNGSPMMMEVSTSAPKARIRRWKTTHNACLVQLDTSRTGPDRSAALPVLLDTSRTGQDRSTALPVLWTPIKKAVASQRASCVLRGRSSQCRGAPRAESVLMASFRPTTHSGPVSASAACASQDPTRISQLKYPARHVLMERAHLMQPPNTSTTVQLHQTPPTRWPLS